MYKIAVLSSSGGTNLQSFIDANWKDIEVSCLITNKLECGAVDKAMAAHIPAYAIDGKGKTREEFDDEVMKILDSHKVDLIVLGGYMRLISEKMVKAYDHQIINIHPSLLPNYPGMDMNVHEAVIEAGEKESGMTIHFVDELMDHGEIILQKKVKLEDGETAESLKKKVQELEKEWYPQVIKKFAKGELPK